MLHPRAAVDAERVGVDGVPGGGHAERSEDLQRRVDVPQPRDVAQQAGAFAEQGGRHQGERGVLRARDDDLSAQPGSALDGDPIHGGS